MYFIRHSRLFNRKGQEEQCVLCAKRSEGRLKRYESCTDNRAWSLDRRERASYILDFMTCIARTEDTLNEENAVEGTSYQRQYEGKALEGTPSQRQYEGKALEGTSSQRQYEGKALEGTSSQRQYERKALKGTSSRRQSEEIAVEDTVLQRQVLPSGNEKEYVSEAIEEVGAIHGEGVGADLQLGDLPSKRIRQESEDFHDDISESSLYRGKFSQMADLQPDTDGGCGCSTKKESLTYSKENTAYGEQSGQSLQQADIKFENKTDDAVQSKNLYEVEKMRGEDETLSLDHLMRELLEASTLNDISESSLVSGKFTQIAALQPNPDNSCGCSPENLFTSSKENTFRDEHSEVPLPLTDITVDNKSDDSVQSKNLFEDETIVEDETLLEERTLDDISEDSIRKEKFTRVAALRPNPDHSYGYSPEKENTFNGEHSEVSSRHANIKVEKNLFEDTTIRGEDETLPLDHIKQEEVAEQIPDDVSESSLHGGKFTRVAALRLNPAQKCVCSAAKELLTSSNVNNLYTVSLQPANIKREKKSDELLPSTKRNNFYTLSLQPAYIKDEKKSDDNLSSNKSGTEDETHDLLDHVKQESFAEGILDGVIRSSIHGEKFTRTKQESVPQSILDEIITSSKVGRDAVREQMDLQSATCSCKVVKEGSFVSEAGMEYHHFVSGSPSSSSKYSVRKEKNPFPEENSSVQYVSYSRSPTINISDIDNEADISVQDKKVGKNSHDEQRDTQTASCSCNTKKKPDHIIKTEKLPLNVPASKRNMTDTVREMKGYNSNVDSSLHTGDDISFDSDSGFSKQRFHACREAKQVGSASKEAVEIPYDGMAYYLVPIAQAQRTEFSFSEKEGNQAGHVAKKEGVSMDVPVSAASSGIKKEDISLPYGEVNDVDGGNMYILMDASQYAEENVSYVKESSSNKQHMCACKEAKETGSVSQEADEIPSCGRVYFLVPASQVQGTEFNTPGKEGKIYDDKVSSETPVTDVIHFNEHMESHDSSNINSSQYAEDDFSFDSESDCCKLRAHACREAPVTDAIHFDELEESHHRNGNIHTERSEKLVRSFDVERQFYKEQMDAAIRKLNDQIKEIDNLRSERDSLKNNLDSAQYYIEQHKQAINKLNNMKKVDEQLSRENEVLLKKIYQLSHTAFNQQTKISKLKMKLKQKSMLSSYIQNSGSSVKGSSEFQPVHVLYPASHNNLKMPYESVFVESYSQYPLRNSTSNAASRYNNMTGNDRYSYNHVNGKRAFVERTVNHVHITSITDHSPQNKKYLDLKKTIRREKDNLLKVTKLIQFQQGVISNLSNCIDNERILLSQLNNARMRRK